MKPNSHFESRGSFIRLRMAAGLLALSALLAAPLAGVLPTGPGSSSISQAAANDLAAKIAILSERHPRSSGSLDPVTISDNEANSYLKFRGREFLPPALHDPEVHIMPDHIRGAANVNFDELSGMGNHSDDLTTRMVAYVFKGTQRVTATGTLETQNGAGKFTLTSLTVGSTDLPPGFINFLLQNYMEKQYKIDLSKPFALPANVSHVELATGRATLRRIALSRR